MNMQLQWRTKGPGELAGGFLFSFLEFPGVLDHQLSESAD